MCLFVSINCVCICFWSEIVTLLKLQKKKTTANNIEHSQQSSERQTHSEPFTTTIPNISEEHCPIDYLQILKSLYIKETSYKNTSFSSGLQCIKKVKGYLRWQHNHL